tara:strand:+ start:5078 stop:7573 length:2496 start_codon:yes stop_codon:yes gene_type:complete
MTRAEVYKKQLEPPEPFLIKKDEDGNTTQVPNPNAWDKSKADIYQRELRRQGKYLNTRLPASFPFYKFSGGSDDKIEETGDKIVRLMGKRNPFSLKKWKDLLDVDPPQQPQPVSVKSVTLPRVNKPLIDIKTDTKSFQAAQYDVNQLIIWLKMKIAVDNDGRKVHLGIFRAAKRVLNELKLKDREAKRQVYLDIQAGVKRYLRIGVPSTYVNEYTFARVLKKHPQLADGVISPKAYKEFHPVAALPTGYKVWRKWAIAMKKKYLRWLNNPTTIQTDRQGPVNLQLTSGDVPTVQVKPILPAMPPAPPPSVVQAQPTLAEELEQKVQVTPLEPVDTVVQPMTVVGSGSGTNILLCDGNEKCNIVIHDAGPGSAYSEKEDYREFIIALGDAGDIGQLDSLELKRKGIGFTYEKLDGKDVIKIPTNGFDKFYENPRGVLKGDILVQRLISNTDLLKWIKDQHFKLDTQDADGDDDNEDIIGEKYQKLDVNLLNKFLDDANTALSQYHRLGGDTLFLHRDIKADNIVVSARNDLYLFDYDMTLNATKNTKIVQAIYNGDAARWDYRNQPETDPDSDDAEFTALVSPALDYFQMGITLLNLGGKFDVSDEFGRMKNSVIKFKGSPNGLPVVGFLNGKNEKVLNDNTKAGKMTKSRLDKFIKALRDPVADPNNLPKQLNLPTSILKRIGNEFLRTYDEMVECAKQQKMIDIQVAGTASTESASQVRTTFLDYDSMSDMELNELDAELNEFTDDELEQMLEEVNIGQAKDDYDSASDSAPTSIAGRSYDSSSDVTEVSYNSSSDAAQESYNSSSDMGDEYDSISEVSASYDSESDEDN